MGVIYCLRYRDLSAGLWNTQFMLAGVLTANQRAALINDQDVCIPEEIRTENLHPTMQLWQ